MRGRGEDCEEEERIARKRRGLLYEEEERIARKRRGCEEEEKMQEEEKIEEDKGRSRKTRCLFCCQQSKSRVHRTVATLLFWHRFHVVRNRQGYQSLKW